MAKPSTPAVWASGKSFGFQPSSAQQAQGFDYIATVRPGTGAPITDDHDWPLNSITTALKWMMDQIPDAGLKSAAFKDVGVLSGQIPTMDDWQFVGNATAGQIKFPNGWRLQWVTSGQVASGASGSVSWTYPFPSECMAVMVSAVGISGNPSGGNVVGGVPTTTVVPLYNWGPISASARVWGIGR